MFPKYQWRSISLFFHLLHRIKPYKVETRVLSGEDIAVRCKQVSLNYQKLNWVSSFLVYRKLVDALASSQKIEVRPLKHLMEPMQDSEVIVSLRHDMDADIVTGVRAARYLARKGLPGSFFLLHTSHYYGALEDDIFYRFSGLRSFINDFLAAGIELGLHADPLSLYYDRHINGTQAVKTELAWLRSLNVNISGTVAHNSAPVYGAENFEIFKGLSVGGRKNVTHNNKKLPLQTLDMNDTGLLYEGNYPIANDSLNPAEVKNYFELSVGECIHDTKWQHYYFIDNPFFRRQYEVDIWLIKNDTWVIASRILDEEGLLTVDTAGLIDYLNEVGFGKRIVVSVHPEYISGD